ncbi:hypothetical protein G7054_g3480 [Neopestalotiopsis clavispora]|nr:hypothetical protein G7054_g3480 [Neopestalotiopsis clavispora]
MSRTNEEKRALLGVWYMSSIAGLVVEQLAVTKYTKYLDECLKELEDAGECKTDQLAVQLVRIQRLTEEICHFHSRDALVGGYPSPPAVSTTARLEGFQVELDRLRSALPSSLKSDRTISLLFEQSAGALLTWFENPDLFSCYYDSACLRIFEPLLAGSHLPDAESDSFASLSLSGVLVSDVFSRFTAALKTWLNSWLAIPVCSYFYMPQPAYAQLVHAATMLARWARIAGPGAVKLSSVDTAASQKEPIIPSQPTPALSGVPSCPDLSLPRSSPSESSQVVSAQILNTLRAQVMAEPKLQIDICGILDTMAARFKAAKEEMGAAQGVEWENDTWDLAAEHLKLKKARIEKWPDIVAMAAGERRSSLANGDDHLDEGGRETMNSSIVWDDSGFEWLTPGGDQDNIHWEDAIFDEIMRDIHPGAVFKPAPSISIQASPGA